MCCEVDNKLDATRLDYSEPSCLSREEADDRDTEPTGSHQHLGFQRGMSIASLNINGLRYHHDEIKFLLNDKRIHFLALNETKLDGSIPKELTEISGYQQLRLDRTCNGGGVSLYVRDSIKMTPRVDVPVLRYLHPKANLLLLLLGTDHQVTRLIPLISWKKPFLSSTRRAKKSFS